MNTVRPSAVWLVSALIVLVGTSCGGNSGYTQAEVDALVDNAVASAITQAQDDFVSEADAQAQVAEAAKQALLVAAIGDCGLTNSRYVTADEAGLVIEGEGDESFGAPISDILCVLEHLEVPQSIITRMSNTNSQMGVVDGHWDVYEAEWTYHPDNGLDIFVVVADR